MSGASNIARKSDHQPAQIGHLVVVRCKSPVDAWVAFPVAAIDADGVVMGVLDTDETVLSLHRVIEADTAPYACPASTLTPAGRQAVRWMAASDIAELKALFRQYRCHA